MGAIKLVVLVAVVVAANPAPAPTQRVLNIPGHHQQHNLSCEAAARAMALSYYAITTDELTLIRYRTNDPRRRKFDSEATLISGCDRARVVEGNPDERG